jgi:hypothetical protein
MLSVPGLTFTTAASEPAVGFALTSGSHAAARFGGVFNDSSTVALEVFGQAVCIRMGFFENCSA